MGNRHREYTVIIRAAEEGGYWAEVEELPGCVSQAETKDELLINIVEAIEACLDAGASPIDLTDSLTPEVRKVQLAA
jgi:predicted RNase H-like HicB family nuclease